MKTAIKVLLIALLAVNTAAAQTVEHELIGLGMKPELSKYIASVIPAGSVLANATYLKSKDAAGSGDLSLLRGSANDDTSLNAKTGKVINFTVAGTPIAVMGSTGFSTFPIVDDIALASGKDVKQVIAAITPSTNHTPSAGSSLTIGTISRLVAGSPTLAAVHLPAATANVGKSISIVNEGSNPVLVYPLAGNAINLVGAATPVSLANDKIYNCKVVATDKYRCGAL
jgi:hypothetical protein